MRIGNLYWLLGIDKSLLIPDATKAGQQAGQAMSGSMAGALKANAGKIFSTTVAAGFALVTKQSAALERAMASFRAETGATAEEARAAGKAINDMTRTNLQPIEEIGNTLAKVHTDLGLTGKAASDVTEQFLQLARVTKRDAAEEVKAFDDILDAWGLTAADASGIMDQLIASHQKYGGVVAEDEAALKTLAPAMKALNFNIDDTLGLLNLFKAKGLDAAATQRAFNSAVAKLPPGTDLHKIIADISAIEDPALRAAAAIKVFGSRGGVALANALAPGAGSLKDYGISATQAAGALDQAATDSLTVMDRLKLGLNGFRAGLGDVVLGLGELGPLIAGVGSILSLAAPALVSGLKGILGALGNNPVVKGAAMGAGRAIAFALGTAAGFATELASQVGSGLAGIARSAATKVMATSAGKAVGAAFGIAMAGATKIASLLGDVLGAIPGAPLAKKLAGKIGDALVAAIIPSAATTVVGETIGTQVATTTAAAMSGPKALLKYGASGFTAGTAFGQGVGKALLLAPIVIPIVVLKWAFQGPADSLADFIATKLQGAPAARDIALFRDMIPAQGDIDKQKALIAKYVQDALTDGTTEGIEKARAFLQRQVTSAPPGPLIDYFKEQLHLLDGVVGQGLPPSTEAGLAAIGDAIPATVSMGMKRGFPGLKTDAASWVEDLAIRGIAANLINKAGQIQTAATVMMHGLHVAAVDAGAAAVAEAAKLPGNIAAAIRSKQSATATAAQLLHEATVASQHPEDFNLIGALTGTELVKGLKSKIPLLHNQALDTKAAYLDRLRELIDENGHIGTTAMKALNKAIHDKDPDVRHEARRIKATITAHIPPVKKELADKTTTAIVGALNDGSTEIGRSAFQLGQLIAQNIARGIAGLAPLAPAPKHPKGTPGHKGTGGAVTNPVVPTGPIGTPTTPPVAGAKLAAGGRYEAGVPRITGELGRELDIPDTAGTIIPHGRTDSILHSLGAYVRGAVPRPTTLGMSAALPAGTSTTIYDDHTTVHVGRLETNRPEDIAFELRVLASRKTMLPRLGARRT